MTVHSDFSWSLTVHGHEVKKDQCLAIRDVPDIISVRNLLQLLFKLDQLTICPGHPDPHFLTMANSRKGTFTSIYGDVTAYVNRNGAIQHNGQTYSETIRSSKCHLLIYSTKCPDCVAYRNTLRSMHHRWLKHQNESPSKTTSTHSHVNERWLNTPQRRKKLS